MTKKQLFSVTVNAFVVKMLMTYPRSLVTLSGNAAWISILCGTLLSALLFLLIVKFYPVKRNVIQIADDIGGKPLKIVTGVIVFVVMSLNLLSLIRIFPEVIKLVLLQRTYIELIGIVFIASLIAGGFFGIEAISRVHAIFIPIAAVFLAVFFVMLIPSVNIDYILPFFGKCYLNVFGKGLSSMSIFSDLLMLNILLPYSENTKCYKSTGIKSIIIGGLCASLIMFMYCSTYVYPVTEYFYLPVYQMERLINLSSFFSRFEAFFQFIWTISILLYGSIYLAVLADIWQSTFNLKSSSQLLSPISVMLVGAAMMANTVAEMADFEFVVMKWIYIPAFILPIFYGIIAKNKYS